MEYTLIEYSWFFIIYAFLGWCIEVSFQALKKGIFINRGFLNGPVCPIYGFGMSILLYLLGPLSDKFILLFLASVVLTSLLELITGFILEKVFNNKWWDYSKCPLNLKGYICLSFSIFWGLGAVFMINIVHPFIASFISIFNNRTGNYLLVLLLLYLLADFIITVLAILKIHSRFRLLEEISKQLRLSSDKIGSGIYKGVNTSMQAVDKMHNRIQDSSLRSEATAIKDQEIRALKERYNKLIREKTFIHRRLEKAYPNIRKKLNK